MSIASELVPARAAALGHEQEPSVRFPTCAWFEKLAEVMADNEESFRELGAMECTMVVRVGQQMFEVGFAGFRVGSIRELARLDDALPSHFVIEGPLSAWREMIENIRMHGAPDLEHTLNYLTFPDVPLLLSGPDQLEVDTFYRYNESVQRYFNGCARFATTY